MANNVMTTRNTKTNNTLRMISHHGSLPNSGSGSGVGGDAANSVAFMRFLRQ